MHNTDGHTDEVSMYVRGVAWRPWRGVQRGVAGWRGVERGGITWGGFG